jgi:hypothetical protein
MTNETHEHEYGAAELIRQGLTSSLVPDSGRDRRNDERRAPRDRHDR